MLEGMNRNGTYSLSIMAMFTAITFLCLFIGYMLPEARIIFYFVASLCSYCIMCEQSLGMGLVSIGIVIALSLLIFPDPKLAIPYAALFSHYGIYKYYLEQKHHRSIIILWKYIYFSIGIAIIYFVYPEFFVQNNYFDIPMLFMMILLGAGFFAYDFIYTLWAKIYTNVFRRMLKNTIY